VLAAIWLYLSAQLDKHAATACLVTSATCTKQAPTALLLFVLPLLLPLVPVLCRSTPPPSVLQ
jgi:hypothetical protein